MYKIIIKLLLNLICVLFTINCFSQKIDFETEKKIIKETLSQYLNTNPNSIATYLRGEKGYKLLQISLKFGLIMEEDSVKKEELKRGLIYSDIHADSISIFLKTKKITVQISDTLFAYKYTPANANLQNETDWEQKYRSLLSDFKENDMARMDTIIGEEYLDLIKKQVNYKGENKLFLREELNHSYYQYKKEKPPCAGDFCMKASKLYRAVFNKDYTKGCYLISFYCRNNQICRSFIFIRKEQNQWVYVDKYPSWIVDES